MVEAENVDAATCKLCSCSRIAETIWYGPAAARAGGARLVSFGGTPALLLLLLLPYAPEEAANVCTCGYESAVLAMCECADASSSADAAEANPCKPPPPMMLRPRECVSMDEGVPRPVAAPMLGVRRVPPAAAALIEPPVRPTDECGVEK